MALLEDEEHGGHGGILAHHDEHERGRDTPAEGAREGAAAGAAAASSNPNTPENKKKHREQTIAIGVAIIGVAIAYMILRGSKANRAATTATTTPAGSTGQVAGYGSSSGYDQTAADLNTLQNEIQGITQGVTQNQQQMQQALAAQNATTTAALGGFSSLLQGLQSEVGQMHSAPAGSGFPNLPAGYSGWKLVNGPGGQILAVVGGYNANRQYSGFEVTGGAPVYAENPGGDWQLGLPGAALQPGASFAVPTQYLKNVQTSNPVTNAPGF